MSKVNCYIDFEFTTTGKKSIDFRKNSDGEALKKGSPPFILPMLHSVAGM